MFSSPKSYNCINGHYQQVLYFITSIQKINTMELYPRCLGRVITTVINKCRALFRMSISKNRCEDEIGTLYEYMAMLAPSCYMSVIGTNCHQTAHLKRTCTISNTKDDSFSPRESLHSSDNYWCFMFTRFDLIHFTTFNFIELKFDGLIIFMHQYILVTK